MLLAGRLLAENVRCKPSKNKASHEAAERFCFCFVCDKSHNYWEWFVLVFKYLTLTLTLTLKRWRWLQNEVKNKPNCVSDEVVYILQVCMCTSARLWMCMCVLWGIIYFYFIVIIISSSSIEKNNLALNIQIKQMSEQKNKWKQINKTEQTKLK